MTDRVTAFEDRQGRFIFVAVPEERGRYVRTSWSVVMVACPACGAKVNEPCWGWGNMRRRRGGVVHADRSVAGHDELFRRRDELLRQTAEAGSSSQRDDVVLDEGEDIEADEPTAETSVETPQPPDDGTVRSVVDLREILR